MSRVNDSLCLSASAWLDWKLSLQILVYIFSTVSYFRVDRLKCIADRYYKMHIMPFLPEDLIQSFKVF